MALAPVAAALAIGGSLIQGVSAIQQGNAQGQAAIAQAQEKKQQDDIAAQDTQIGAEQQQADRLDQLRTMNGTIRATIASRNLDASSPSAMALEGAAETYAYRDIARSRFNALQTSSNYRLAGTTAMATGMASASMARAAGYSAGISSLFKAASFANTGFNTAGTGGYTGDGNGEW